MEKKRKRTFYQIIDSDIYDAIDHYYYIQIEGNEESLRKLQKISQDPNSSFVFKQRPIKECCVDTILDVIDIETTFEIRSKKLVGNLDPNAFDTERDINEGKLADLFRKEDVTTEFREETVNLCGEK